MAREEKLYAAILTTAYRDLCQNPIKYLDEIRDFVYSEAFEDMCDNANLSISATRRVFEEKISEVSHERY
jgi:hypothetical protein